MNGTRVLMLHQFDGPHHAHRAFGDAVDADYAHFETGAPPGGPEANADSALARLRTALSLDAYDVVIGEGTAPVQTLLWYKARHPGAHVVPLIADETFRTVREGASHHLWTHGLGAAASRALSGGVAVGALARSWAERYLDVPFAVVHPPVAAAKYDVLDGVAASYEVGSEPVVLHAGTVSDAAAVRKKNVDLLARTASERGWRLRLLGRGHGERAYADLPGVEAVGYVEDLAEFAAEFAAADVYVQPSSGDAFPVASLEAMLAGVPTVVSTATGTRELVDPVDSRLVCEPTVRGIAAAVDSVLGLAPDRRREVGARLRAAVEPLTERRQAAAFADALEEFVS